MNQSSSLSSIQIKEKALDLGFHKVGIAAINDTDTQVQGLQAWLGLGYHADMEWMRNPKRQNIKLVMPEVRSLICVALNYYTEHQRPQEKGIRKNFSLCLGKGLSQNCAEKIESFFNLVAVIR